MPAPPTRGDAAQPDRLSGRWLPVARAAWIAVAALTLGLFIVGIPAEFTLLHVPCPTVTCPTGQLSTSGLHALEDLGFSLDSFAAYTVAMDILFAAVCTVVALLIFWRRSDDRMGLLVSLALITFGTATFVFTMEALATRHPAWETPTSFLHFLGAASFGLFLYLFPDGRFVPSWTRWVVLVWIVWQLPRYFFPNWYLSPGPDSWHASINMTVWLGALGTAIFSQGFRYRRTASSVQRQQIKWVVFGISAALAVFLGISLLLGRQHVHRLPCHTPHPHIHRHRRAALPPLRHRHHHQPHPRLRYPHGDSGSVIRGHHRSAAEPLPRSHRTGVPSRRGSIHPGDSRHVRAAETAHPGPCGPQLLPSQV